MEKCHIVYKALYHVIAEIQWHHWTHFYNGYSEKMTSPISQCYIKERTRNQRWKSHLSTQDITRICCLRRWAKGGKSQNLSPRELVKDLTIYKEECPRTEQCLVQNQGPQQSSQVDDTASERWKNTGSPTTMALGLPLPDSSLSRAQWSFSLMAVLVKPGASQQS